MHIEAMRDEFTTGTSGTTAETGMPGRWLAFLAVGLSYIAVMMALTPASLGLPTLAAELNVDVADASLVQVAYLVALASLVLPAGRIGDILGFRGVFLAGVAVFTAAGLLAGLAPGLPVLVAARALQGVGAALVSGTALAILTRAFPAGERGRIVAAAAMAGSIGAGLGTLLTPVALATAGWPGIFWMVVPAGLASLLLGLRMAVPPLLGTHRNVDVPGAALLAGGLFAFATSFNHLHDGPRTFDAAPEFHIGAQVVAFALLGLFVWRERNAPEPLVPLRHLTNGRFSSAVGANGIFHMTMMAMFFLTPFLFEEAWGLSTFQTAIVVTLFQAINVVSALGSGWLVDRTHWSWLSALALAGIAAGMLLMGVLGAALTVEGYIAAVVIIGLASGLFNAANNTTIMSVLPEDARGFSSGTLEATRQFGHAIAVSLGAIALGLAGAGVAGSTAPAAMLDGFSLALLIMGSIAAAGVYLAWRGGSSERPSAGAPVSDERAEEPGSEPVPVPVPVTADYIPTP
jgi:MFS family permease